MLLKTSKFSDSTGAVISQNQSLNRTEIYIEETVYFDVCFLEKNEANIYV